MMSAVKTGIVFNYKSPNDIVLTNRVSTFHIDSGFVDVPNGFDRPIEIEINCSIKRKVC